MHTELLTPKLRNEWQNWVFTNTTATFYHRVEWQDVIEASFNHGTFYIIAIDNGKIHGVLPLVHIKSLIFGNILCSMPFLNFGGICADSRTAHDYLFNAASALLKKTRADYVEFRHIQPSLNGLQRKEHKVSMTVALNEDPEELWNLFKSKHRTTIRRAAKNGLEIVRGGGELIVPFYNIISRGWHDLGTPIYRIDFFKNIVRAFNNAIDIYVVYYEGKAIATAFNGLFRDTVEGMWTYSLREYASLQTNYLLYWEMIKDACLRGFKKYHLGRSTNESGAAFYKSKWNAQPHQLYWEYLLNEKKKTELPDLNVDNPKYRFAINMWQKMPLQFTNLIGPFLAKSIP